MTQIWYPRLAHATSWRVGRIVSVFQIVWFPDPPPDKGYTGKVIGIPDSEVTADCWEALEAALLEHIDNRIDEVRKASGLPYQGEKIELTFEQVSEEEFGPLFEDEAWDEE